MIEVTRDEALMFLGHAFRNIECLGGLSADDLEDIRDSLSHFFKERTNRAHAEGYAEAKAQAVGVAGSFLTGAGTGDDEGDVVSDMIADAIASMEPGA